MSALEVSLFHGMMFRTMQININFTYNLRTQITDSC